MLPTGFTSDEISAIQTAETVRGGAVASFYTIGGANTGHEGLYPMLLVIVTEIMGSGLLAYRLISAFSGLISVALAYALGRRLFGNYAGLAAAVALAVTFWPVLLSRSVLRETLLLPLILALLLVFARALHLSRTLADRKSV